MIEPDDDDTATRPATEVLVDVFERMVRRLEERVAIAEARAAEVERRMTEALDEARRRADEHLERVLSLEAMLKQGAEERAGLVEALQESIKAHQLQSAAPVAMAQVEAERERSGEVFGTSARPGYGAPQAASRIANRLLPPGGALRERAEGWRKLIFGAPNGKRPRTRR
jgi:hypothetical protein